MLQACTVHLHHSHTGIIVMIFLNQCYFVCPVVCFLIFTTLDRESWHYIPKFKRVSCDILVCIIYDTNVFHHYKPRIQFIFFCNYGTVNYIQVIIYFLIIFPLSHRFWKFIFLSWIPSSRFLFILAFYFLLQTWKNACLPLLDIVQMLWQMVFLSVFYLCVEVYQATQGIPSYIECRQLS
jgi:hypothetical protein